MAKSSEKAQNDTPELDEVVARTERMGVIGSPSRTSELAVDVVGTAVGRKLVGELALFPFKQDSY